MLTRWRLPPESRATWSSARSSSPISESMRATAESGSGDTLQPGEQTQVLGHAQLAVDDGCCGTQPSPAVGP